MSGPSKLASGVICALLLLQVAPVLAQSESGTRDRSVRGPGTMAAGASAGWSKPTGDDDLDNDLIFAGWFEYFQTSHLGWRGMVLLADYDGPDPGSGDVEVFALTGNAVWHFEGSVAQPFVTGGFGFYGFDPENGDDEDLEPGVNMGGGVDLFLTQLIAIEFEGLLHGIDTDAEPDSFFSISAGIRFEF